STRRAPKPPVDFDAQPPTTKRPPTAELLAAATPQRTPEVGSPRLQPGATDGVTAGPPATPARAAPPPRPPQPAPPPPPPPPAPRPAAGGSPPHSAVARAPADCVDATVGAAPASHAGGGRSRRGGCRNRGRRRAATFPDRLRSGRGVASGAVALPGGPRHHQN